MKAKLPWKTPWNICWPAPRPAITAAEVLAMLDTWRDQQRQWRERPPLEVCLKDYDALLGGGEENEEPVERFEHQEVAV